jgi:hypothetical protein
MQRVGCWMHFGATNHGRRYQSELETTVMRTVRIQIQKVQCAVCSVQCAVCSVQCAVFHNRYFVVRGFSVARGTQLSLTFSY